MPHPFNSLRGNLVEKSRVGRIAKGYAAGGAVKPSGSSRSGLGIGAPSAGADIEGTRSKPRLDRPGKAKPEAKTTNVTVVVAPQGGGDKPPMMPPPGMAGPPPAMAPKPPMPMVPPGANPPGLQPRPFKRGGRVSAPKMTAGAESGMGRLQKARAAKRGRGA